MLNLTPAHRFDRDRLVRLHHPQQSVDPSKTVRFHLCFLRVLLPLSSSSGPRQRSHPRPSPSATQACLCLCSCSCPRPGPVLDLSCSCSCSCRSLSLSQHGSLRLHPSPGPGALYPCPQPVHERSRSFPLHSSHLLPFFLSFYSSSVFCRSFSLPWRPAVPLCPLPRCRPSPHPCSRSDSRPFSCPCPCSDSFTRSSAHPCSCPFFHWPRSDSRLSSSLFCRGQRRVGERSLAMEGFVSLFLQFPSITLLSTCR